MVCKHGILRAVLRHRALQVLNTDQLVQHLFKGGNLAGDLKNLLVAAARAIADLVKPEELCPEFIIPNALNKEVAPAVAKAVMEAARRTGVARI